MKTYSIFYFNEKGFLTPANSRFGCLPTYETFNDCEIELEAMPRNQFLFTILPIYDKINY